MRGEIWTQGKGEKENSDSQKTTRMFAMIGKISKAEDKHSSSMGWHFSRLEGLSLVTSIATVWCKFLLSLA